MTGLPEGRGFVGLDFAAVDSKPQKASKRGNCLFVNYIAPMG